MTTQETIAEVRRLDAAATKGDLVAVRRVSAIMLGESGHARQYRTECIVSPLMEKRGLDAKIIDAVPEGQPLPPPGPDSMLLAFCRTAAPALADAIEARDRVIHALTEAVHNAGDDPGSYGLTFVDGKWRIEE